MSEDKENGVRKKGLKRREFCRNFAAFVLGAAVANELSNQPLSEEILFKVNPYRISFNKPEANYYDKQSWRVCGLAPGEKYIATLRPAGEVYLEAHLFKKKCKADLEGKFEGNFVVDEQMPIGDLSLRIESAKDLAMFAESKFHVGYIPSIIYSSDKILVEMDQELFRNLDSKKWFRGYTGHNLSVFEESIPKVEENLGLILSKKPIKVNIIGGPYVGGMTSNGEISIFSNTMADPTGSAILLGEYINTVTGQVTSGWPYDWWANGTWHFPRMAAIEALKESGSGGSAVAAQWFEWGSYYWSNINDVYLQFKKIKEEKGWPVYRRLFSSVVEDKMNWERLGENPSALLTNYVLAYLSLGYGSNIAKRFKDAGVKNVDETAVGDIIRIRQRLCDTQPGKDTYLWELFRDGKYREANG